MSDENLRRLTELCLYVSEIANMPLNDAQPYVGRDAFAHKGGLHVDAVQKNTATYEHIGPESVGNEPSAAEPDLFSEYRDARLACGQGIQSLSPEKFELLLEKQRAALRERYGDAEFRFRVAVEQGKVKLKASRQRTG